MLGKHKCVQGLALYLVLSWCSINTCKVNWMKINKRHLNTHTHSQSYWICVTCQANERNEVNEWGSQGAHLHGDSIPKSNKEKKKAIKSLGYHYIDPWGLQGMCLENLWIPTLANTIIACYFLLKWIKYNLSNSLWPIIMQ